jgi:putative peptide zinc metalloprotease protein
MAGSTFSETWHRVARARLGLLPSVAVHKQRFRGADWFVLRDTYTQRFFRVSPQAYRFIARLTPDRTVDDLWREFVERHPGDAPGQEDVMQVLAQLHHSNLLYYGNRPDSLAIFNRYREHRQRELRGKLLGFLYVRIPLWDPNDWLGRIRPFVHLMTSTPVMVIWLLAVLVGGGLAVANAGALADQTQGLLAPSNLGWLYLCLAGMKILHEFGHAFVVKRYGGDVHVLGVMFLVFVPLPYVDATASWSFRRRRERMLVGGVGILVELFLAALGAMVWAATGPGLINGLAFNVMIIGSVSSLVFNGNPLLRFDAYYVFSDLVDIPNLYQRASQQWLYFADRYLLGTPTAESPARDPREWWWLTGYGAASFVYRILVVLAILMFVSDQWFAVGVLFAMTTAIMLVLIPGWKWIDHLRSQRVHRNRPRALAASAGLVLVPLALLAWLPLPDSIKAPGIVEAEETTSVSASVAGVLHSVVVTDGARLQAGDLIAELENPGLEQDLQIVREQIAETRLLRNRALGNRTSEIAPLEERLDWLAERESELLRRRSELRVRAQHDGVWVARGINERIGSWLPRGDALGQLVDDRLLRFSAVVSQEQADRLFGARLADGAVRLNGQTDHTLELEGLSILPYQRRILPSAALGWMGGGEVAVKTDGEEGQTAAESFYEVRSDLSAGSPGPTLIHGMSGWLRIPLPPQPALTQLGRSLDQLLQKRYRL